MRDQLVYLYQNQEKLTHGLIWRQYVDVLALNAGEIVIEVEVEY